MVCDLATEGARFLVAEGGQGGRGNARFLSNKRRAPAFAEQGEKGQEFWLDMELKLMADVALVGFPNAGKSTLISTVSAAKPKIADYPFTTLEPHLGVVRVGGVRDGTVFVMADIPGLVEGAAGGKGLGHQFLRHIERARVLVVLLDLAAPAVGGDAPSDAAAHPALRARLLPSRAARAPAAGRGQQGRCGVRRRRACATWCSRRRPVRASARSSSGWRASCRTRGQEAAAAASSEIVVHRPAPEGVDVRRAGDGAWVVVGRAAERAVALSDLNDVGRAGRGRAAAAAARGRSRAGPGRRARRRRGDRRHHDLHLG